MRHQVQWAPPLANHIAENIRHKLFIQLQREARYELQKGELISEERSESNTVDARMMTRLIAQDYADKGHVAALWLAQKTKDPSWIAQLQERAWERLREVSA